MKTSIKTKIATAIVLLGSMFGSMSYASQIHHIDCLNNQTVNHERVEAHYNDNSMVVHVNGVMQGTGFVRNADADQHDQISNDGLSTSNSIEFADKRGEYFGTASITSWSDGAKMFTVMVQKTDGVHLYSCDLKE